MRVSKSLTTSGSPCPHCKCPRSLLPSISRRSAWTARRSQGWRCPWWRRSARSPTRACPWDPPRGAGDHAARGVRGPDRGAVVRRDRRVRPRHRPRRSSTCSGSARGATRLDHPPSPARPRPGRGRSRDAHVGAGPTRRPTRARRCPGAGAAPGARAGRQDRARRPHPTGTDTDADAGTVAIGSRIWCRCSTRPAVSSSARSRSRRRAARSPRSPRCSTSWI